jgi:hypothetical protein
MYPSFPKVTSLVGPVLAVLLVATIYLTGYTHGRSDGVTQALKRAEKIATEQASLDRKARDLSTRLAGEASDARVAVESGRESNEQAIVETRGAIECLDDGSGDARLPDDVVRLLNVGTTPGERTSSGRSVPPMGHDPLR